MLIQEQLNSSRQDRTYKGPAKRLIEKLTPISSQYLNYQKRWFWELLQNACDFKEEVRVELEITNDKIQFRHNGRPFSPDEAMNLIAPDTSKDSEDVPGKLNEMAPIGKFGTGFISTHVLSYLITVQAIIKENDSDLHYEVSFDLDRKEREDRKFLMNSIEEAEKQLFQTKQVNYTSGAFTSFFTYDLTKAYDFVDAEETIEKGLLFIQEVIPYVFTFTSKIYSIDIIDKRSELSLTSYKAIDDDDNHKVITQVFKGANPASLSLYSSSSVYYSQAWHMKARPDCSVRAAVKVIDNVIQPITKSLPRLFCVFPMIGTETFPVPCIFNSQQFVPKTERDGIELNSNDQVNRDLLTASKSAYNELLDRLLVNKELKGYSNLANIRYSSFTDTSANEWFKRTCVDEFVTRVLDKEVVLTPNSEEGAKKLRDCLIPYIESDISEHYYKFYDLISGYNRNIPERSECENWFKSLNFKIFATQKLDLEKFCKQVAKENLSLESLFAKLNLEGSKIIWLKDLLNYVKEENSALLYSLKLIPNSKGDLVSNETKLYLNGNIDPLLIDLYFDISVKT